MVMVGMQGRGVAVTGAQYGIDVLIGKGSAQEDDNGRLHAAFIGGEDHSSSVLRVGLLGCGNIGFLIAAHADGFEVAALYDQAPGLAPELAGRCGGTAYDSFETFVSADVDLVVEAASPAAVRVYGEAVLRAGKDLVVMSVGALADPAVLGRLREAAIASGRRVRIPSGAVMGLDNLKIGRIGGIDRLVLRTTKNPASLGLTVAERVLVFKGRAEECVRAFPKNINVSAAIAIAAGQEIEVELWADPTVDRNIHEIFAEGPFGDACLQVRNVPSPDNPATSYLAALSVLTLLRDLSEPIVVGT
ncbi:Aspartate dehydrogenase [Methanosphaerula palustris E1-9c]|uniref:L-aspartate dehydrogenase n=2 Tax=Methanosphaerula palustris TaxID=475088 RepID=B8GI05_METPE|nr:Aspartate dehydrogenase [Methanosphaerula palustris E1-9c]